MSRPIQNRGGRGRRSNSSAAELGGSLNGNGTEPPRSRLEQDANASDRHERAVIVTRFMSFW